MDRICSLTDKPGALSLLAAADGTAPQHMPNTAEMSASDETHQSHDVV